MTKGGSKFIKIKINIETGKVKVKDENNNAATELTQVEVDQECQGKDDPELFGEIFRCQFNPNCMYVKIGNTWYRICY